MILLELSIPKICPISQQVLNYAVVFFLVYNLLSNIISLVQRVMSSNAFILLYFISLHIESLTQMAELYTPIIARSVKMTHFIWLWAPISLVVKYWKLLQRF